MGRDFSGLGQGPRPPVGTDERAFEPRPFCYECFRPRSMCLCDRVGWVKNRTGIVILQHVRERFHPFGSARLLAQGLARCQLHVAYRAGGKEVPHDLHVPAGTALLYPRPGASLLSSIPTDEQPRNLLLLDGTWSQAHRLYRDNGWLRALPHVTLAPSAPSLYRVRREPKPHCLSTLEAAVAALRTIEPDTPGLDGLLSVFAYMNEQQIKRRRSAQAAPRRKRARRRPSRAVPDVLRGDPSRLVVVYGESAQLGTRAEPTAPEPLQWVALRFDGRSVFERFVLPSRSMPAPDHLDCMGLSECVFDGAVTIDALRADWTRFLRPDDVVVAWNNSTLRMHDFIVRRPHETVLAKRAYTNVRKARPGMLEDVIAREGLSIPSLSIRGRASQRLANAHAITAWLVEREAAE